MPPKKRKGPTPVESLKHKETRANIPTEELREFVRDEEESPKSMLYPRNPDLDPQLVWKGKDEQDRQPLEVPIVPIYIQEKIHPQALIENLRETAAAGEPEPELSLFDDFNGIRDFRQKIDFYSHDPGSQPKWTNRMILGDSLLVMTSLAEKEGLKGKVQMIYMDPPYGIKFGSNWQVSTRRRDVKDGNLSDVTRQPEQIKAFRDTWEQGIHSYLSYLRDRLVVCRNLLTDTGSIFVQIGADNVHLVRSVLDEVFGSRNAVSQVVFKKTTGAGSFAVGTNVLASIGDYLLWYAKEIGRIKYRQVYLKKDLQGSGGEGYNWLEEEGGVRRRLVDAELPESKLKGRVFTPDNLTSQTVREAQTTVFPVPVGAKIFTPRKGGWKTNSVGMERLNRASRLIGLGNTLRYVRFFDDFPLYSLTNLWQDTTTAGFADEKSYVVQTNVKAVERCVLMASDPGDLVLDPTCGSGTTAYVAEHWGRRWIAIDTSRVALTLARTRLMSARYPYYLLTDSAEGREKEAAVTGSTAPLTAAVPPGNDVKRGFVYERVPHVTLKSIANNDEIDEIHARYQAKLEPFREHLNRIVKQRWEEWQIPREPDDAWPAEALSIHEEWWKLRRQRQAEIDASIARRADTEHLYDRPYEDPKRVRVSGPFTVESLSPHRVLSTEEERPASEAEAGRGENGARFETTILDNLRKAGVQNTKRSERMVFDRLEPFPGQWIQALGEYTDRFGKVRRVGVSIGPEHGTVGPRQIQEAAKEAMRGIPVDILLVLGFAFDPHSHEIAGEISPTPVRATDGFVAEYEDQYGKLPILLVRMNPDLAMGDELLKKTGAGNLFMIFGEPDVDIQPTQDGRIVLELRGLDIYDPTTGFVRSSSPEEDIACWFIDTSYNDESFFVRHAYFTGGNDPYDKLKRALRADIDEAAWQSLYSTRSNPFDPPKTGKIAIKVINHYGDEVLKVYEVK